MSNDTMTGEARKMLAIRTKNGEYLTLPGINEMEQGDNIVVVWVSDTKPVVESNQLDEGSSVQEETK